MTDKPEPTIYRTTDDSPITGVVNVIVDRRQQAIQVICATDDRTTILLFTSASGALALGHSLLKAAAAIAPHAADGPALAPVAFRVDRYPQGGDVLVVEGADATEVRIVLSDGFLTALAEALASIIAEDAEGATTLH